MLQLIQSDEGRRIDRVMNIEAQKILGKSIIISRYININVFFLIILSPLLGSKEIVPVQQSSHSPARLSSITSQSFLLSTAVRLPIYQTYATPVPQTQQLLPFVMNGSHVLYLPSSINCHRSTITTSCTLIGNSMLLLNFEGL